MIDSMAAYQRATSTTAIYPGAGDTSSYEGLSYVTLGLAGEAGEIANKVKKIARDQGGIITYERQHELIDELGDAYWYLSQLATQLGTTLNVVSARNLVKLADRRGRNKLQGSGDQR